MISSLTFIMVVILLNYQLSIVNYQLSIPFYPQIITDAIAIAISQRVNYELFELHILHELVISIIHCQLSTVNYPLNCKL